MVGKRFDKRTLIDPSKPEDTGDVIIDRTTTDRYNDPGLPMTVKNKYGYYVLKSTRTTSLCRALVGHRKATVLT